MGLKAFGGSWGLIEGPEIFVMPFPYRAYASMLATTYLETTFQLSKTPVLLLMDKILHDPKDPKLWELWYIPYNG